MKEANFERALKLKYYNSLNNDYGKENYDENRFGPYTEPTLGEKIKNVVNSVLLNTLYRHRRKWLYEGWIKNHGEELSFLYNSIDTASKKLLIDIIAYRILGYKKVKLPLNNKKYFEAIHNVNKLKQEEEVIDPGFMHFKLNKFNLKPIGYDVELFFTPEAIVTDFIVEQYALKDESDNYLIQANEGDVVLDVGGCWGDTALYFASKVENNGKVYSFEFIPNNISIFNKNTKLNPHLENNIQLVKHPVSDQSDIEIFYKDMGPASTISSEIFNDQTGSTTTLSIDDFVERNNIEIVNFIKMDIEGAEPMALKGAINTIKKFKPTLAIAIYHSMEDFVNIPKWIVDLNLGYELHLSHNTIHTDETIIFAEVK